jgi:hypothetical protein
MTGLLIRSTDYYPDAVPGDRPRYDRVIYLAAPAAWGVTERAAASLPAQVRGRVSVRELPAGALA